MSQEEKGIGLSSFPSSLLNWSADFLIRVEIHGVLPVLALLSVEFPDALQRIFSWLNAFLGGGR
jgi:hypothetical protein